MHYFLSYMLLSHLQHFCQLFFLEVLQPNVAFIPLHLMTLTIHDERNYEPHYAIFCKYFTCEEIQNLDTEILHQMNPLNPELNPICYLLALLGAHHFLHVSRIRVKLLTFRPLMSYIYIYIYGAPILDVSRSHTTTQHSR